MRKVFILIIAMAMYSGIAQVQFKPEKGDFTTELQFRPFSFTFSDDDDNPLKISPFSLDGFRFRYFFNEKFAIRANIKVDYASHKDADDIDESGHDYYLGYHRTGTTYLKQCKFAFGIAPGFEYHFGKFERLSIYAGVDLFFGMTNYKYEEENDITVSYTNPYSMDFYETRTQLIMESNSSWPYLGYQDKVNLDERNHFTFGANAFLGFDFYIYKGLYVGAELGISYNHFAYRDAKVTGKRTVTTTEYGATTEVVLDIDYKTKSKSSTNNVNFKCEPAIRLGWKF